MDKRNLYVQACKAYQAGTPIMTNLEFDELERELLDDGHSDLVDKTHDELSGSNIEDKTFSIRPLETWEKAIDFVKSNIGLELLMTLKFDGVCGKIQEGTNFRAQSRGRDTEYPWDYTKALRHIVPVIEDNVLVVGESFLPAEHLDYFKEVYDDKKYKLPRSAALSLLRTPEKHLEEDLDKLVFIAYNTDRAFPTKSDMFDWLSSVGFNTPKYCSYTFDGTEDIKAVIKSMMEFVDTGYPSDGVVLEVNDLTIVPEVQGKYLSTQVALKIEKWGQTEFTGIVKKLINTPKKGGFGAVLLIEPVLMPDGITQQRINAYNAGIVLREGIGVGSEIKFSRKANSMCGLIYGGGKLEIRGDSEDPCGDSSSL